MKSQHIFVSICVFVEAKLECLIFPRADGSEEHWFQGGFLRLEAPLVFLSAAFEDRLGIEELGSQKLGLLVKNIC